MTIAAATLDRLKAVVGPGGFVEAGPDQHRYLREERGLFHGATPLVLRPASTEQVAALVRICAETRTPIVPQGGNTGLVGGGVPSSDGTAVIISLGRMNRIRALAPDDNTITVEAGCVLADIQAAAAGVDRLFPVSLASEGSCQIGGNISTNAGGTNVLRYGNTRPQVLGLEVVLPDGQIWDGLRGLRKDNTGYDLKQMFIGAEGTLGIITAAVLALYTRPASLETAFVAVPDLPAAITLLHRLQKATGERVSAFEVMSRFALDLVLRHIPNTTVPLAGRHPWHVLVEAGGDTTLRAVLEEVLAAAIEDGTALDATIAESGAQAQAMWRLRETLPEAQKPEGGSIKHDVAVPLKDFPALVDRATDTIARAIPGVRPVVFGHLGDGNVHFNLTQPEGMDKAVFLQRWGEVNRIVHGIAHELHGSISAEHGLGQLKREEITHFKSGVEMDLMRKVKAALDPLGIMNPGKVV